jgi:hydroxyacylglutathione hydrolase
MLFRRLKTPGLAHHSYILGCGGGEAVVVDPRRDVVEYLELARRNGLRIACVLETHRQEDFEHGSSALAALTGARIVKGEDAELRVGDTRFVTLRTPGHTPESVCYAVYRSDAGDACWGVFTGDTLFAGETGRTDLADPARTAQNAALLYDAVHARLAPLGDQALIFPAHGAGSACGGNIAERDDSTLGLEKRINPVFTLGREAFVEHKLAENLPRPPYFSLMERVNLRSGRPMAWPLSPALLSPAAFRQAMAQAVAIDTRSPDAFAAAHIPASYNIWLEGLASFAGWVVNEHSRVLLVVDALRDIEPAVLSLARVGVDALAGVLAGGIRAWREHGLAFGHFGTVTAAEAAQWRHRGEAEILDVRDEREWREGHIPGAMHVYVGELERKLPLLRAGRKLVVHCSVGNRSGLASSVLARHGYRDVYNMLGGMKAWRALNLPLERTKRIEAESTSLRA